MVERTIIDNQGRKVGDLDELLESLGVKPNKFVNVLKEMFREGEVEESQTLLCRKS